jgi:ketosteroid isomerase-like protein
MTSEPSASQLPDLQEDDDLIVFAKNMDRCWMERRFADLAGFIADDVVMVAPAGSDRMQGLGAAIASYREFMSRCEVRRFDTGNHHVTRHDAAAVVEYEWDMAWNDQGTEYQAKGREILMLAREAEGWRVIWRTQIPV